MEISMKKQFEKVVRGEKDNIRNAYKTRIKRQYWETPGKIVNNQEYSR